MVQLDRYYNLGTFTLRVYFCLFKNMLSARILQLSVPEGLKI